MKKFIILFALIISGSCVFALDYNVYKLNNGQTVIIKQVTSNPIVIIDTWVKTGSINENDKNTGVSHFLEHLFFKGTQTHPTGEFDRILESKGAVTNAATSKDFTHYYIKIPSKDFDLALKLHADMLLNPQIPRKEMEKERKVVLEEIAKDKNSPSDKVYENLNELIFKVHPYKRQVIGTKDVIENITREEILEYYNTHYAPENMITVVVGDINPEDTVKKVENAFKTDARKLTKMHYQKEPSITSQRVKEIKFPCNSAYMMIGFRGTNAVDKDQFALDILSTVLGGGRSSRFYQNIKEDKQLADSISTFNLSQKDDGIFVVSSNFLPENKDKLKTEIFEEIKKIQKNGITQEELKTAKNIIIRDTHYSRESISNVASEMGYTIVLTGNHKDYDDYLKGIENVTINDVKRVATKYLQENKSAVSIVVPETYKETPRLNASKDINHCAKLVKSEYETDKYLLDNGATLLLNSHKNNDIVAISIKAKGGILIEPQKGTSALTANLMMKGTKHYSQIELSKLMEENGINISPACDEDFFEIDVLTTKEQLSLTLKLLDEIVNNAVFEEIELQKTRKNILNNIKSSRDIPLTKALEEYKTLMFKNSPYENSNKILEQELPKVTRKNIVDYYNKIFNSQNLVISVNGNIDSQDMINTFSKMFKIQNGKQFSFNDYLNKFPTHATPMTITSNIKNLETSWIILGWETQGTTSLKDYATLQIINTFMGTGMSSRLFKVLRETSGLAYQVGSGFSPHTLKGAYTMYIGTNPKNTKLVQEQMLNQINLLKTEFVSENELQNAKDQLIGKFILALETNLDKANGLARFEASGRGFEFVNKYPKLIESITASDIMEAANKYFNDNYVKSIVDRAK